MTASSIFLPSTRTALVLCCAALCGLLVGPRGLQAIPPSPIVPGAWEGTVASDTFRAGTISLEISSVERRRFDATIAVQWLPSPIVPPNPSEGTVSDSGEINIESGDDDSDIFFEAHGRITGNIMNLTYRLRFSDGTSDTGSMSLVQSGTGGGGT